MHLPPIFISIFFCILYNISESLSRFWFYVSHNFGCLVSLISLLSHNFSSQYPYLCYLPKILVPIFGFLWHIWVLFNVSIFSFLCKMQSQVWSAVFTFVSVIIAIFLLSTLFATVRILMSSLSTYIHVPIFLPVSINRTIYCNAHAHRYDLEISWWLSSSNGFSV